MIDRFSRFIVGKLLTNKKAETIMNALMENPCMNLGFPSYGFFADNGGEFANLNLDELTTKFGPAYSSWSNGLNERNLASANITIKKLMEEKKTALTDS